MPCKMVIIIRSSLNFQKLCSSILERPCSRALGLHHYIRRRHLGGNHTYDDSVLSKASLSVFRSPFLMIALKAQRNFEYLTGPSKWVFFLSHFCNFSYSE